MMDYIFEGMLFVNSGIILYYNTFIIVKIKGATDIIVTYMKDLIGSSFFLSNLIDRSDGVKQMC